jgi:hypothetical protein
MTRPGARLVLPVLWGSLLLAGCADETAAPASTPSPVRSPAFDRSADVPPATPMRALTTLTGTVSDGVEAGCTVLVTSARTYLLLGDVPAGTTGRPVTVTGRPEPTAVTTCRQGTPFLVQSLTVG